MKISSSLRSISMSRPRSSGMVLSCFTRTPSMSFWAMAEIPLVRSGCAGPGAAGRGLQRRRRDEEVGRQLERLEGAGVGPPALEGLEAEVPLREVAVVDVGDLELAAGRRLEGADEVEDLRVVEVDAGHGEVALRIPGLLHDPGDLVALHLGHPEALRVLHGLQHHLRALPLLGEASREGGEVVLEDVVPQDDADRLLAGEVLREPARLGDAA